MQKYRIEVRFALDPEGEEMWMLLVGGEVFRTYYSAAEAHEAAQAEAFYGVQS